MTEPLPEGSPARSLHLAIGATEGETGDGHARGPQGRCATARTAGAQARVPDGQLPGDRLGLDQTVENSAPTENRG
jgi:hypothetical protein